MACESQASGPVLGLGGLVKPKSRVECGPVLKQVQDWV